MQGVDIAPYVIKFLRTVGSAYFGEVWAKVTSWQGKQVLVGTIIDVSNLTYHQQQLQAREYQLQQSLTKKEALLREVYHRTKNNMLVIISMLTLQLIEIPDQRVKTIFHETENRIRAMTLVHEKLYQSKNLAEIELGSYLQDNAESLITHMTLKKRISLQVDVQPVAINIDNAIPLGLVVNEIITNSLQHAFPEKRKGTLLLKVTSISDNTIHVTIADDRIGLVDESDLLHGKTFGMQIIYNLVTMLLKGTIAMNEEKGPCYQITFPKTDYIKHIQQELVS